MAKKPKKHTPAPKKQKTQRKPVKPAAKKPLKPKLKKPVSKKPAAPPPKAKPAVVSKPSKAVLIAPKTVPASKPTPPEKNKDKTPAAKPAPVSKNAPAAKPAAPAKAAPAPAPVAKAAKPAAAPAKDSRADLRTSILAKSRKAPARPISFSFDEVREVAKVVAKTETEAKAAAKSAAAKSGKSLEAALARPTQPNHVKAASLADILGFNPKKTRQPTEDDDSEIPERFRRYYKLLIELRNHVTGQLDQHTEDTLKRSSKDDAGDLSSYGQHMADAGTDTFDRDFALSVVSNEQEALSEVEAAIKRIKTGTYGICEITQKPIAKERLLAVPFTRYSAEAQKDIEKNRHRSRTQAGLFGEGEEGGTISGGDDGGGDD